MSTYPVSDAEPDASPEMYGAYGATNAYVLALNHSLQHELAGEDIRIQAVLPVASATEIGRSPFFHTRSCPPRPSFSPEDAVDAALVGLDRGELVTIAPLQDGDEWTRCQAARRALSQHFDNSLPAPRYRISVAA